MLTKLGQRGYAVREELGEYRVSQFDTDTDSLANDTQADTLFNLILATLLSFPRKLIRIRLFNDDATLSAQRFSESCLRIHHSPSGGETRESACPHIPVPGMAVQ